MQPDIILTGVSAEREREAVSLFLTDRADSYELSNVSLHQPFRDS